MFYAIFGCFCCGYCYRAMSAAGDLRGVQAAAICSIPDMYVRLPPTDCRKCRRAFYIRSSGWKHHCDSGLGKKRSRSLNRKPKIKKTVSRFALGFATSLLSEDSGLPDLRAFRNRPVLSLFSPYRSYLRLSIR